MWKSRPMFLNVCGHCPVFAIVWRFLAVDGQVYIKQPCSCWTTTPLCLVKFVILWYLFVVFELNRLKVMAYSVWLPMLLSSIPGNKYIFFVVIVNVERSITSEGICLTRQRSTQIFFFFKIHILNKKVLYGPRRINHAILCVPKVLHWKKMYKWMNLAWKMMKYNEILCSILVNRKFHILEYRKH